MSRLAVRVRPPHDGEGILQSGVSLGRAAGAAIMVHGRGSSAADILSLSPEIDRPDLSYVAPQARCGTWYPLSFLAPLEQNEPALSSAIEPLDELVAEIDRRGLPPSRQLLLGFSQGACLALEFAARHPRRYGAVIGLSGGLIGPTLDAPKRGADLAGTPILLASSDPDPHVPWRRVVESAENLEAMGAEVDLVRYPGLGHTIHPDELERTRELIAQALADCELEAAHD